MVTTTTNHEGCEKNELKNCTQMSSWKSWSRPLGNHQHHQHHQPLHHVIIIIIIASHTEIHLSLLYSTISIYSRTLWTFPQHHIDHRAVFSMEWTPLSKTKYCKKRIFPPQNTKYTGNAKTLFSQKPPIQIACD